jgi:hypothetical protein
VLGHAEVRLLDLLAVPGAQDPDEQADQEERARRQQQQAVGVVPAALGDQGQDLDAEQLAGAEQLADHGHEDQHHGIAEAVADAVDEARQRRVLHGEGLGPAHDDAVGDDQADEHRQLLADVVGHGLEHLVDQDHQRGDDRHLHDDADAAGMWRRIMEMNRLENAVTEISATHITRVTFSDEVTASAEQMPRICSAIGLLRNIGLSGCP